MLRFDVSNTRSSSLSRNVCAVVAAVSDTSRLSRHEIESLFHEWGHVLAAVFSRTRYQQLASTRAPLDFVETPSMLFERLAWHPAALSRAGVKLQQRENAADDVKTQMRFAKTDLLLHSANWREELQKTESFSHLGPYGASYYSYLVCRLFASNLYHECLKPDLSGGKSLKEGLLVFGGARDPLALIRECTKKDPFQLVHFHH
jgi:intermediate peptidase